MSKAIKKTTSEQMDEILLKKMTKHYIGMEESMANLIQQLGEGHPKVLADISTQEHNALSVALAYANWLGSEILNNYVNDFLRLSPARKGKRAKQLTQIGIASRSGVDDDEKIFGRIKRRLGIGSG